MMAPAVDPAVILSGRFAVGGRVDGGCALVVEAVVVGGRGDDGGGVSVADTAGYLLHILVVVVRAGKGGAVLESHTRLLVLCQLGLAQVPLILTLQLLLCHLLLLLWDPNGRLV